MLWPKFFPPISRSLAVASFFAAAFAFPFSLAAQSWNDELAGALDRAVANYYNPSVLVVLGTFTYAHEELASPFSRWLGDELHGLIPHTKSLRLFDKDAAAAMDPAFRQTYAALFDKAKVDAILYGRFFDEGGGVRVHFELTGLFDGSLIGATDLLIPRAALPRGISIRPGEGTVAARAQLASIATAQNASIATAPSPSDGGAATAMASQSPTALPQASAAAEPAAKAEALRVSVSTDRGPGAVYKAGEELQVLVTVNERAWVKVYHVDVMGKAQLIWPNRFSGSSHPLEAGTIVRIPGESDPFSFILGAPFGTEFIKALASSRPFAATEEDFSDLSGTARESITRGIGRSSGGGEQAEALASYLILEK